MRVADHEQTWMVLILPFMEDTQLAAQWDFNKGCFYNQTVAFRTALVQSFFCPSMPHDAKIIITQPDAVHGHPRNDPQEAGTQGYRGSISDYRAALASTCVIYHNDAKIASPIHKTKGTNRWDNGNSHLADGASPQCNPTDVHYTTGVAPSANKFGVTSFRPHTGLKSITDGSSKTLLYGEVGRASGENGQAFNGDNEPGVEIGIYSGFADRPTLPPVPVGYTATDDEKRTTYGDGGFGSAHNGVVQFVMCDGSVVALSTGTDLNVLDRMATRAGDDPYDLSGGAKECDH